MLVLMSAQPEMDRPRPQSAACYKRGELNEVTGGYGRERGDP
jgi:hypothetical protein